MFQYQIGSPPPGFTPILKAVGRIRALRTLNWFLVGTKDPMHIEEIGTHSSFRFIITHPDGE